MGRWPLVDPGGIGTSSLAQVIDDGAFADLAARFEPAQITEICLTVGMSNVISRFHAAFRTEVDRQTSEAPARTCCSPTPMCRRTEK